MRAVALILPVACLFADVFFPTAHVARAQNPVFIGDVHKLERDVLATLNAARARPRAYMSSLMSYRGYFRANLVVVPGRSFDVETHEGAAPVDEAIDFLNMQDPLGTLQPSETLRLSATDLVAEQSRSGVTGHYGASGDPEDRSERHGGGRGVAEVIAYGVIDAKDAVRQLVIDDGVADRGHRALLFSDHLRYAGVACGPHPTFGTMCVIDLADMADGEPADEDRSVKIAAVVARKR